MKDIFETDDPYESGDHPYFPPKKKLLFGWAYSDLAVWVLVIVLFVAMMLFWVWVGIPIDNPGRPTP